MDVRSFAPLDQLLLGSVVDELSLESSQCKAITQRLVDLHAATAVFEHDYVDGNYLSEYASYYVRCHEPIAKLTLRLHFFRADPSEIQDLLRAAFSLAEDRDAEARLRESYLGFIVIKPLPKTIVGKTCLLPPRMATAPGQSVHFPVLRDYPVLLWGMRLTVRSLAFQEQDNEVAACSTAAMWSALHALEQKITTESIPSTFDITAAASLTYIKRSLGEVARRFPTTGLGLEQMEAYLRSLGLDCIVCGATLEKGALQVAEYLLAYASAGFPMLLVGSLYVAYEAAGRFEKLGLHAMTALGYGSSAGFMNGHVAQRLERVFAHDDNLGPFSSYDVRMCRPGDFSTVLEGKGGSYSPGSARVEYGSVRARGAVEQRVSGFLSIHHEARRGIQMSRLLTPEYFIIPIDPKIRMPYEGMALFAEHISRYFKDRASQWYAPGAPIPELAWSITLHNVTDLKTGLRASLFADRDSIREVLLKPFPKHIWVVSFSTRRSEAKGCPILDCYFDATALRQSGGCICMLPHEAPDADTFLSVITACLFAFDHRELPAMDADAATLLRAAAHVVKAASRDLRRADQIETV